MELSQIFQFVSNPKKHIGITEPKTYGHVQFRLYYTKCVEKND